MSIIAVLSIIQKYYSFIWFLDILSLQCFHLSAMDNLNETNSLEDKFSMIKDDAVNAILYWELMNHQMMVLDSNAISKARSFYNYSC